MCEAGRASVYPAPSAMPNAHLTRRSLLALAALPLLLACSRPSPPAGASAVDAGSVPGRLRIAVVPKGTTHEFWKTVHAGAIKAGREGDVDIVWKGPLKEDDLKAQIDVVQSFTAQGVSGIVLAPLSDKALVASVKGAAAANVPVVIFDSDLKGQDHVSFVATDNHAAGKMAAEEMIKRLGGKGNVVVLRYQEGSASTTNREEGFLERIRQEKDIKVVSDNQFGGATTESAFAKAENLLSAQKGAAGIQGVFAPNESTTFGMLLALRKAGLAGKIRFVGFDSSPKLVQALEAGDLDGLVLQDPFKIGYLAVTTMTAHLRGKKVEPRIDTGARVVTKESLADPAVKELVAPDLQKWLAE
jgi:ribose transport system substrate-binding protein